MCEPAAGRCVCVFLSPSLPVSLKSCFLCSGSLALNLECLTTAQMAPIYHCLTCVGGHLCISLLTSSHLSPSPPRPPVRPILRLASADFPGPPLSGPLLLLAVEDGAAGGADCCLLPPEQESFPGPPNLQPQLREQTLQPGGTAGLARRSEALTDRKSSILLILN